MDKAAFIKKLENLIKDIPAYDNLERMDYQIVDGYEYLYATYTFKQQIRINITGDSEISIMKDFLSGKGMYIPRDSSAYLDFDKMEKQAEEQRKDSFRVMAEDYMNGCFLSGDALFDDELIIRIAKRENVPAIELKEYIFEHYLEPEFEDNVKTQMTNWLMTHSYCEVTFDTNGSVCVLCDHAPSKKELLALFKKDMERFNASDIKRAVPIGFKEAHERYHVVKESEFPILKRRQKEQELSV